MGHTLVSVSTRRAGTLKFSDLKAGDYFVNAADAKAGSPALLQCLNQEVASGSGAKWNAVTARGANFAYYELDEAVQRVRTVEIAYVLDNSL